MAFLFTIVGLGNDGLRWETAPGSRSAALNIAPSQKAGFTLMSSNVTGIAFANLVPELRHLTNQIVLNGSGVAAGDVDGDGWCDLLFAGLNRGCRLYRNLGQWKFQDITESSGVGCAGISATGVALVDLDGDGSLDLVVNSLGNGTHVFYNDGHGHFHEAPFQLNGQNGGMTIAVADVDGDGFLDLYLANYRTSALMDVANARATFARVNGQLVVETLNGRPTTDPSLTNRFVVEANGGVAEQGEADVLYRSIVGTNFVAVPFESGRFLDESGQPLTHPLYDWGLTASFRDLNGDTLPDLYVCDDFQTPDRLWLNQGNGVFRLAPALTLRRTSLFSMAIDFADINRDGRYDFFVLDMLSRDHAQRMRYMMDTSRAPRTIGVFDDRPQYGQDMLFLNRGDGTFAEIGQLSGVEAAEWAWSCVFLDVDLDGWEDLLVSNGMERAARDMDVADRMKLLRATRHLTDAEVFQARRMFPRLATANLAFRNRGDLTFEETGATWGFNYRGVSQGMALADLDNDGDLDLVINNFNAPPCIYRNEASAARVAVRLKGLVPNTRGIGATIAVRGGAVPLQKQEITAGGRYLSSDEPMRVFAAGSPTNILTLEVTWRSGRQSRVTNASPNRIYEIDEASAVKPDSSLAANKRAEAAERALFEDMSFRLGHTHHEEAFDDFARQPLLPNLLSQLGPGATWFDWDGDGWDDLILGTGKGGRLAVFRNNRNGGFETVVGPPFDHPMERDVTSVVGWHERTGQSAMLAGLSNYEDGNPQGAAVRQYVSRSGTAQDVISATPSAVGPLALADLNGDGRLALFVGGRVLPGRYPELATSQIFHEVEGRWVPDAVNNPVLNRTGLVSGVVFSDLDGDGWPELVLAVEWGPVRIYHNRQGRLEPWDPTLSWPADVEQRPPPLADGQPVTRLSQMPGWWTSVNAGDFDGDGRMDLVVGNWGRNSKYESFRSHPLELYYGDLNQDGNVTLIEAYFDPGMKKIVPERQLDVLSQALPYLRERYPSHRAFGLADVQDILGTRYATAQRCQANWLDSTVLLNRGDHFEVRPLPVEAQFTPTFGLCVGEMDGDGAEDLFLAQNFFDTQPGTARYDAGLGLWLKGDGRGAFVPLSSQQSGVKVYGEQRGAALADYDGDGRVDLAVTQNGAATMLYHNVSAAPGLRLRLKGPVGNPDGIGAVVRLQFANGPGPAREIHCGSGYWSQDSAVQVLATPHKPESVWVRWPGGYVTTSAVPESAKEVLVSVDGRLTATR